MTITAGIDIGTNSIKSVLFRIEEGGIVSGTFSTFTGGHRGSSWPGHQHR